MVDILYPVFARFPERYLIRDRVGAGGHNRYSWTAFEATQSITTSIQVTLTDLSENVLSARHRHLNQA